MKRLALVLALAACSEPAPSPGVRARERFVRDMAAREGLEAAWQLGDRSDVRFEDDLSTIQCVAPDGTAWSVTLPAPYGYIKRTKGADGDHVDITLGPSPQGRTFIVDQIDPKTGRFDEHKLLGGFDSAQQAQQFLRLVASEHGFLVRQVDRGHAAAAQGRAHRGGFGAGAHQDRDVGRPQALQRLTLAREARLGVVEQRHDTFGTERGAELAAVALAAQLGVQAQRHRRHFAAR